MHTYAYVFTLEWQNNVFFFQQSSGNIKNSKYKKSTKMQSKFLAKICSTNSGQHLQIAALFIHLFRFFAEYALVALVKSKLIANSDMFFG